MATVDAPGTRERYNLQMLNGRQDSLRSRVDTLEENYQCVYRRYTREMNEFTRRFWYTSLFVAIATAACISAYVLMGWTWYQMDERCCGCLSK